MHATLGSWRRALPAVLLLATTGAAPALVAGEPVRRALLVGIEAYAEGEGWPVLSGPRADVESLAEALVERAGFAREHVHTLFDERATHAAIVSAFRALVAETGEDDVLLFYFAGHGSQVPDASGDEVDGLDETLIPFDVRTADGAANDLLDDEIAQLIEEANERTPHVVFLFDCCSSGTNVRGTDAAPSRYVPPGARGLAGTRDLSVSAGERGSGYFPPQLSYVSMAACRSDQSAFEHEVESGDDGPLVHGVFTYALLQELYEPAPTATYEDLLRRVRARVRALRPTQTPVLEGPLDGAQVFAGGAMSEPAAFNVRATSEGAVIEAGLVHGIREGAVFDVRAGEAVARARVERVRALESRLAWLDAAPDLAASASARLVARGPGDVRLGVHVCDGDLGDVARLAALLEATGSVRLAAFDAATYRIRCADGRWTVYGPTDAPLPLTARTDDEVGLDRLAFQLDHLAAAHRARDALPGSDGMQLAVDARIERVDAAGRSLGPPPTDFDGVHELFAGERIGSSLTNRSPWPVYASLLVVSPDGAVALVHRPQSEDDAIPPGATVRSPRLVMTMPEGTQAFYAGGTDAFRWVATTAFHDLRPLEQAPVTAASRTRGADDVPAAFAGSGPVPLDAWVTRTLEVRVRPKE